MDFIHTPYQPGETIAAIATPPGEGGVAIIRISGKQALDVAEKVFSRPIRAFDSHTAHYGHILDAEGKKVDDVLIMPMLGKRSYAGEDTVEIYCHGGSLITRKVLEVVLAAGARAALPGEFTFKAFINGKIDLAQAEAVQELIGAKNEKALEVAENQLQGNLSEKVRSFQTQLTLIAAILEAWVDFPDEGLEFASMDEICHDLEQIIMQLEKLVATFHNGKILHDGLTLCLIGCPNVGKSSLMNALLDKERAIVSPIPGTTRDLVEDHLRLNGLNFKLVDTAGIREADEIIEQEGIRRSRKAMEEADLILYVLDAHAGLQGGDQLLLEEVPHHKTIAIWNKSDIKTSALPELPCREVVYTSAKTKQGLEDLHAKIDAVVWTEGPPSREEIVVTNVRHKEALGKSALACRKVLDGLKTGVSPEFLAIDIREGLGELGKVIGTNISDDILTAIFSTFCIGK